MPIEIIAQLFLLVGVPLLVATILRYFLETTAGGQRRPLRAQDALLSVVAIAFDIVFAVFIVVLCSTLSLVLTSNDNSSTNKGPFEAQAQGVMVTRSPTTSLSTRRAQFIVPRAPSTHRRPRALYVSSSSESTSSSLNNRDLNGLEGWDGDDESAPEIAGSVHSTDQEHLDDDVQESGLHHTITTSPQYESQSENSDVSHLALYEAGLAVIVVDSDSSSDAEPLDRLAFAHAIIREPSAETNAQMDLIPRRGQREGQEILEVAMESSLDLEVASGSSLDPGSRCSEMIIERLRSMSHATTGANTSADREALATQMEACVGRVGDRNVGLGIWI